MIQVDSVRIPFQRAVLLGALSLGGDLLQAAQPGAPDTTSAAAAQAEQTAPADAAPAPENAAGAGEAMADAIRAGTVLTGMTLEQVLQARGEPIRKEVIPPDAELWHYAAGEVAFSGGRVSYENLAAAQSAARSADRVPDEPAATPGTPPARRSGQSVERATVHTPGDGFLALRSDPSIRRGRRLDKIPHGTVLTLDECRTWPEDCRWCRTRFRGQTGWVFERYVVR